ncbi:MAG: hypothetical protein KF744_08180 [Taibaiella sp.]|nr:hypothetical protein [Taibaiella sp.]
MKSKTTVTKSLAVLACAALLASCAKRKDNTVDQTASLTTATITGKVSARLVDTAGAAATQYVSGGVVVNAWVDTRDYVLNADTNKPYARKYYTATTDANGYYNFAIDVSPYKAATVHLEPSDFEANVLKVYTSGTEIGTTYNMRHVFKPETIGGISLNKGQSRIIDINYN